MIGVIAVSEIKSKYVENGSPTTCFRSFCGVAFVSKCFRASEGHYFCSQECASKKGDEDVESAGLSKRAAQMATVCECIDQCFAFDMWCYDFATYVDEQDMAVGLHVAFDLMSVSTRLFSFVALRKLDEFLRSSRSKPDDLIASDLGIDRDVVMGSVGERFLTATERIDINKRAAHLTEHLVLEDETEIGLREILDRSKPIMARLSAELRKADAKGEIAQWADKTDALLKYAHEQAVRVKRERSR